MTALLGTESRITGESPCFVLVRTERGEAVNSGPRVPCPPQGLTDPKGGEGLGVPAAGLSGIFAAYVCTGVTGKVHGSPGGGFGPPRPQASPHGVGHATTRTALQHLQTHPIGHHPARRHDCRGQIRPHRSGRSHRNCERRLYHSRDHLRRKWSRILGRSAPSRSHRLRVRSGQFCGRSKGHFGRSRRHSQGHFRPDWMAGSALHRHRIAGHSARRKSVGNGHPPGQNSSSRRLSCDHAPAPYQDRNPQLPALV